MNERTDGQRDASLCPLCLSGASILWGGRTAMFYRNLSGGEGKNPGLTNKYTKFGQLIIGKIVKIATKIVTC